MSATKFFCVKTVSGKVVRRHWPNLSVQKWLVGEVPFYVKIWPKLTHPFKNADFNQYLLVAPQP